MVGLLKHIVSFSSANLTTGYKRRERNMRIVGRVFCKNLVRVLSGSSLGTGNNHLRFKTHSFSLSPYSTGSLFTPQLVYYYYYYQLNISLCCYNTSFTYSDSTRIPHDLPIFLFSSGMPTT